MEESHRKVLRKLRIEISKTIDATRITQQLFAEDILEETDRDEILAEKTNAHKAWHLLDLLPRKGPEAFPVFLQALNGSGAIFLANAIQSKLSGMGQLLDIVLRSDRVLSWPTRELRNVLIIYRLPVIRKVAKNAYFLLLFIKFGVKRR